LAKSIKQEEEATYLKTIYKLHLKTIYKLHLKTIYKLHLTIYKLMGLFCNQGGLLLIKFALIYKEATYFKTSKLMTPGM